MSHCTRAEDRVVGDFGPGGLTRMCRVGLCRREGLSISSSGAGLGVAFPCPRPSGLGLGLGLGLGFGARLATNAPPRSVPATIDGSSVVIVASSESDSDDDAGPAET